MTCVLQAGDVLTIRVSPSKGLNRETVIHPDGTLLFPLVGVVRAQGLTPGALEKLLAGKLRPTVRSPRVRVSVLQVANNNVFVMGRVAVPGAVAFRPDMKVLGAISAAGGFQDDAERSRLLVYRGQGADRKTLTVDVRAAVLTRDPSKDFPLQPGDIVDVPSGGNNLSILGMVARPGSYPWKEGATLLELVSDAGGFSPGAKTGRVFIYRQSESGRRAEEVNVSRIMDKHPEGDPALKPGDMVMVPEKAFYAGTGAVGTLVTPWATLATLVVAIVLATK
jgi:polysaccharide export outer membrane protein